jgi:hypothetical protein
VIFVVFGIVGWPSQAQQDQVYNAIDSGKVGRAQFMPGLNQVQPVGNSDFGNYFRVEFTANTDADATWQQIKTYLAANPPVAGSRIRRLNCSWDVADPTQQACTIVQELSWRADGSVQTRP